MIILGFNLNTHDTGAAIVKDGKIIAAVNEERLSRKKMDDSPPRRSIQMVLRTSNVSPSEIDILALSELPLGLRRHALMVWQQLQRVWYTKGKYLASFLKPASFSKGRLMKQIGALAFKSSIQSARELKKIIAELKSQGFKGEILLVDHDRAHAAGAYYTSGMDEAFVAIIEGSSFTNACSFWTASNGKLKKVFEIPIPHSPGRYYEVVTLLLGFHPKKHGGKITGLAAYGDPQKCYERVSQLLYMKDGSLNVSPRLYALHDEYFARGKSLPRIFAGETREDIAAAFQKRLEDVLIEQFLVLGEKYNMDNLVLSGGVCANVKLNMELASLPKVKQVFIHPGMGDSGQALGAALDVAGMRDGLMPEKLKNVYFGPAYKAETIEQALQRADLVYKKPDSFAQEIARLLANNKVVGFFQGGMEYGPRALGNRTIMYPATDSKVNDWLNSQLKRTEFMPFAPVTLAERAGECYLGLDKYRYAAEFMTIAMPVTDFMKQTAPAAVHVDGTARPQLIKRETNPVYYDTIKAYELLTGLPTVINTSFNMHEEPIVCTPTEAIRAYQASSLDALAIGPYLVINESR